MYNLNTKRVTVGKNSAMEWVSGSFGSHTSYLYPMTVLKGDNSKMDTPAHLCRRRSELDTGGEGRHIGKQ